MVIRGFADIYIDLDDDLGFTMQVAIVDGLTKELIMEMDTLKKLTAIIKIHEKKILLENKYEFNIQTTTQGLCYGIEQPKPKYLLKADQDYKVSPKAFTIIYTELPREE